MKWLPSIILVSDVVYAAVQPTGQTAASEVVHGLSGQSEEEDHSWVGHHDFGTKAKDVLISRVEGL